MNDLVETLWVQFAIETEEHQEVMESLLLEAEGGGAVMDISALFRSFHSVKGLARAMDLHSMQEVAHRSEDLLGLVREKRIVLTPSLARLLLEAVDALKILREEAVSTRSNGPLPEELVQRLRQSHAQATSVGTSMPAATPTEAPPPVIMAPPPPAPEVSPPSDAEEPVDEMLRFFAEMLQEEVPRVALIMVEEFHTDASSRERARNALEAIQQASEVMEFLPIHALAEELLQHLPDVWPLPLEKREWLSSRFIELRDLAEEVKRQARMAPTPHDLPAAFMQTVRAEMGAMFTRLLRLLENLTTTPLNETTALDEDVAAEITRVTSAINTYLLFFACEHACYLMLLLQDVYHHVKSGRLYISRELLDASMEGVRLVENYFLSTQTGENPPDTAETQLLVERIRKCLFIGNTGKGGAKDPYTTLQEFLGRVEIKREILEILSPENVHDLVREIQKGGHPYIIHADLERDLKTTQRFISWLEQEGGAISNRTCFEDGHTTFEYLVVSPHSLDIITQKLADIDPGSKLLRVQGCPLKADAPPKGDESKPAEKAPERLESGTPPSPTPSGQGSSMIRVAGEVLDAFMNQIGEMVLVRSRLHHAASDDAARQGLLSLSRSVEILRQSGVLPGHELERLEAGLEAMRAQQRRISQCDNQLQSALMQLQERSMALRVVPIDTVFKRFPRMVRDLAQSQNKNIRLNITGQEVRIDKGMVDSLVDPLLHMIRNSVDHGVETPEERKVGGKSPQATINLRAVQSGNRVVVEIEDDGRGIDVEKVRTKAVSRGLVSEKESLRLPREQIFRFIFQPGFSTAAQVTETSGRGVGMDVVLTTVMRLGGNVRIESETGRGSTFFLELPLSAAIQNTLLVDVAGQVMAIPDRFVTELLQVPVSSLQQVKERAAILLRGAFLPMLTLGGMLGRQQVPSQAEPLSVIVLANGKNRLGLVVDRVYGRQELFIKEIHPQLAALPGVGGASILGDGRVVLIMDGEDLFRLAGKSRHDPLLALAASGRAVA